MSFDPETGEPWRCKFCVFYFFCKIGRCVAHIPIEFFTEEEVSIVEKEYRKLPYHESGGGFTLGWSDKDDEEEAAHFG